MKQKLKRIIWPIIYLILIINVCLSFILVFRSYYFRAIFVSGNSMNPTLKGGSRADYGVIDDHKSAINHLKRFNIVTTYYPFAKSTDYKGGYVHGQDNEIDKNNSSYKIKRVYGLPNETIRFDIDDDWANEVEVLKSRGAGYACPYASLTAAASSSRRALVPARENTISRSGVSSRRGSRTQETTSSAHMRFLSRILLFDRTDISPEARVGGPKGRHFHVACVYHV